MPTAQAVINSALKKIRALRSGESPAAEDAEDCLAALNAMLDTWSSEGLTIFAVTTDTKALTAGDDQYSIGTSADIDTARPTSVEVESCFIRDSSNNDYPLSRMTKEEYNRISDKASGNAIPSRLLYEQTYANGTIYLQPPPEAGLTLHLVSLKPFTTYTDLSGSGGDMSFPPGYQEAIEFNLAVRIAPDFGKTPSQYVVMMAEQLLSNIKTRNLGERPLRANVSDVPVRGASGRIDILTGE